MHAGTEAHLPAPVATALAAPSISPDAHALLAQARNAVFAEIQAGRFGQGLSLLQEAMALGPLNHDLLSDMAALMLSAGQLESAAAFAQQALDLQPCHGVSLYSLGFALSALGELASARVALGRLAVAGPCQQSLLAEAPDLLPIVQTELARIRNI